jgi:hypothetical protein
MKDKNKQMGQGDDQGGDRSTSKVSPQRKMGRRDLETRQGQQEAQQDRGKYGPGNSAQAQSGSGRNGQAGD